MHRQYARYLQQTNAVLFTVLPIIKQAKCHLSSTITGQMSLFDDVSYSLAVQASAGINNTAK